jgi:hypothetical protein
MTLVRVEANLFLKEDTSTLGGTMMEHHRGNIVQTKLSHAKEIEDSLEALCNNKDPMSTKRNSTMKKQSTISTSQENKSSSLQ